MAALLLPSYNRDRPAVWLAVLALGLALALLPASLTGVALTAAAGVAIGLARPRWALYALAFTVPYQSLVDVKVYGVSVSITEAVVVVLAIAWLTQLAAGRVARPVASPLIGAIGLLLLTFALSSLVATDLNLAAKELLKWSELAVILTIGASLLDTPRHRQTLLLCLITAAASEALLGLVQSFGRFGPAHFMIGGVVMRAYGTFEQPNPYGGYLGLALPLAFALVAFGLPPGRRRWLVGSAAVLIGLALALTLSRGAWTGQLVALTLVVMVGSPAARRAMVTFGGFGAVVLTALWPLLPAQITGRLASAVSIMLNFAALREATVTPENWALLERFSQWFAGWNMFTHNPLLGVGIGNYNSAYGVYRLEQWPVALGHAHNHYLTIAAEAGLLGLSAYLALVCVVAGVGLQAYRAARDRPAQAVVIGILGSLTAFATHNLFDVLLVHGMGVTVGLLLALLMKAPLGVDDQLSSGSAPAPLPGRSPINVSPRVQGWQSRD